jgi:hypothetical protein
MKFFYLRDKSGFPVAGVASILTNTNQVQFSLSVFNPKDSFDRARARAVAEGRLRKGKLTGELPLAPRVKTHIIEMILTSRHICGDKKIHPRVREAARLWLESRVEETPSGEVEGTSV